MPLLYGEWDKTFRPSPLPYSKIAIDTKAINTAATESHRSPTSASKFEREFSEVVYMQKMVEATYCRSIVPCMVNL
jgi:hypothetical protein